jgi:(1->4)-alpha-D-glucan 1-alpha-D-glucosylmutase
VLNPSLGGAAGFERFSSRLRELGLGLLLDIVPNHMAAHASNPWWRDVLQNGPDSQCAPWFDIDWRRPGSKLRDKVLLPILEDHYAKVLEAGKLQVLVEACGYSVAYYEQKLPLSQQSCSVLKGLAEGRHLLGGKPGVPGSFDALHTLLEQQHYRLAYWRTGLEEINYRRFFDVSQLVSLRMELPALFELAHQQVFQLVRQGQVTGLRIDHPDGLWDPAQYVRRVQQRLKPSSSCSSSGAGAQDSSRPSSLEPEKELAPDSIYMVVEKILMHGESLPLDWPVAGTTGYDFLNRANGLFVARANRAAFDKLYAEFIGQASDFDRCVHQNKKQILFTSLVSDLDALVFRAGKLAEASRYGKDLTFHQLRASLAEIIAAFPVYRTYLAENTGDVPPAARDCIASAVERARQRNPKLEPGTCAFIKSLLLLSPPADIKDALRQPCREFVMRFQQLTGPVMAKGVEDTTFYNFNRLVSLNEVGGFPGEFGLTLDEFHAANLSQSAHWPHTLLATATHDTKRGEDCRARLNVLSEMPASWQQAINRWCHLNAGKKNWVQEAWAPHPNDEYLLYQILLGAWSADPQPDQAGKRMFCDRICAYLLKALRESKARTSWLDPNQAYEDAAQLFVQRILSDSVPNPFLEEFMPFQRKLAFFGRFNSLSQVLLKLTAPGVPDFYQGSELWDLSLVDPDNRRPVDYPRRIALLASLKEQLARAGENLGGLLQRLLCDAHTGQIKLYLIWRTLQFRLQHRDLFERGEYVPLAAFGSKKEHVCAYARILGNRCVLVLVPRLVLGLAGGADLAPMGSGTWEDTAVTVPEGITQCRNVLTGEKVSCTDDSGLTVARALNVFPVALLASIPD